MPGLDSFDKALIIIVGMILFAVILPALISMWEAL